MPMAADDIARLIKERFPDAEIRIEDLAGDGDHYSATDRLRGVPRQDAASSSTRWSTMRSREIWAGRLHALALKTAAP